MDVFEAIKARRSIRAYDTKKEVKEILGIPPGVRVVAMAPLGYPAEKPEARPRKSLDEVVSYERF